MATKTAPAAAAELIVVGSVNQDNFVYLSDFPQPGQTILANGASTSLGGKGANQAIAAAILGASVSFVGQIGNDPAGEAARSTFVSYGIDHGKLASHQTAMTGAAYISVNASGENTIVVHSGANSQVDADLVAAALEELISRPAAVPRIVLAQGELPAAVVDRAASVTRDLGVRFLLNLAPVIAVSDETLALSSPLVVNEGEALELLSRYGVPPQDSESGVDLAIRLSDRYGTAVVVTLGAAGAAVTSEGVSWLEPSPRPARIIDTTGAGDAFVGAMTVALCCGFELADAVRLGTAAGSHAVGGEGTTSSYATTADLPELERVRDSLIDGVFS